MKKRILAAMLAAVMVVAVAAGCGKSSDSKTDASGDAKAETETETNDETRKVVLVTAGIGEPYSLLADDGTWTGIDAEMWAEIEKRTGWEVEVKQASFDSIWGELDTQRADVSANCWAVKPERTEKYYATIPYYGDAQCVIVPESNNP